MGKINFNNYLTNHSNKYYDTKVLINIIEDIYQKDIVTLCDEINKLTINITNKEIMAYLNQLFEQDNPELKKKLEQQKDKKRNQNIEKRSAQGFNDLSQEMTDEMEAAKYRFEPYSLSYFKKYTDIVREKASLLLAIIRYLGNKETEYITDRLNELDIQLDNKGNISKEDIIRLIEPTVYNIDKLRQKVMEGNNPHTYISFKMSLPSLYRNGISEEEIYPGKSLQIYHLCHDHINGNIALSQNQKQILEEERDKNMKLVASILLD